MVILLGTLNTYSAGAGVPPPTKLSIPGELGHPTPPKKAQRQDLKAFCSNVEVSSDFGEFSKRHT